MSFITQGKTNLSYILIIVILAVIVGGGILVWQYLGVAEEETELLTEKVKSPTEEAKPSTEESTKPEGPIDCKANLDCFIEASESCSLAKVTYTAEPLDLFGLLITGTEFYEIKGYEDNKCVFYTRTEEIDVKLSKLVQELLDTGSTQEQIQQKVEQEVNEHADLAEGLDGTCKFNKDDLTAMLNRWKDGWFSSDDFEVAECEGEKFGQQAQEVEEKECLFSKDCKEGFHCFKKRCISNDVLSDASKCSPTTECTEPCVGCKKEKYSCMSSSEEFKDQLCVECFTDMQCKSEYSCEEYKCAKK